jgi:hypothetical protein
MRAAVLIASCGAALLLSPATAYCQRGTQRLVVARSSHALVALADGRALLAGGSDAHDTPLASVELLVPQGWTLGAPMAEARAGLCLTLLRDGRVLATGGAGAAGPLASAEVWSPTTQAWSAIAPMREARAYHVAVLLADGRVLVAGGAAVGQQFWTASAEIWDPATDSWSDAGQMTLPRQQGTAALAGDGRVVVSGSHLGPERADLLDLFDPRTRTWTPLQGPLGALEAVAALADGTVLVLGHTQPSRYVADSTGPAAVTWDPTTDSWTAAGDLAAPSWPRHATVLRLADGRVVVAGGMRWEFPSRAARARAEREACEGLFVPTVSVRDVVVWSPSTRTWSRLPALARTRTWAAGAQLSSGVVLVTGGKSLSFSQQRETSLRSVEALRP